MRDSIIGRISFMRFCGLSFGLSPGEIPCIYFDWFLVCGISLSAAQLFVIAIESILQRGAGNPTRPSYTLFGHYGTVRKPSAQNFTSKLPEVRNCQSKEGIARSGRYDSSCGVIIAIFYMLLLTWPPDYHSF